MSELKTNITQRQLATDWLKITIQYLKDKLDENDVSRDRLILYNSFAEEIAASGPEQVESVMIKFKFYLRYLDMGVGRGVPVGSRFAKADYFKKRNRSGKLIQMRRKKKSVYNKPMAYQIKRYQELLTDLFGFKAVQVIEQMTEKNKTVEIKID
ncbi:MAG: hypothetical protein ABUT20_52810 [Bacteroidota bacterium]